jgi:hypothetical protein
MNNDRPDWREEWEKYRPYILNDMTFTFIVMVVMFIVAAIVVF